MRTLIEQIESIPGREQVREIVIDMSGTYRALIKRLFPQAEIIADKFAVRACDFGLKLDKTDDFPAFFTLSKPCSLVTLAGGNCSDPMTKVCIGS